MVDIWHRCCINTVTHHNGIGTQARVIQGGCRVQWETGEQVVGGAQVRHYIILRHWLDVRVPIALVKDGQQLAGVAAWGTCRRGSEAILCHVKKPGKL